MKRLSAVVFALFLASCADASWYWPFGEGKLVGSSGPRLSELTEKASTMIDEAADLADEGKANEAIEKYRAVLEELDRIERENPDRANTPEFSTVRNKRAYVNAKIDSMLMNQVKVNARVVAVSDTSELEARLADERWGKSLDRVRGIGRDGDGSAQKSVESVLTALKAASQMCSNDLQVAVTCETGAAKLYELENFDRADRMLDYARARLAEMKPTTNATEKTRLRAGLREVKNVLAVLALSSRTNDVGFCLGLSNAVSRLAGVSRESDRVVGKKDAVVARAAETNRVDAIVPIASKSAVQPAAQPAARPASRPRTRREQAIADIARGDYAAAELVIREMLRAKPNGALALNLKAALEMRQGRLKEAEETLDRAIANNGRSHFAYYNMARLMLRKNADDKSRAQKYYDTGRTYGGPKDPELEALLK